MLASFKIQRVENWTLSIISNPCYNYQIYRVFKKLGSLINLFDFWERGNKNWKSYNITECYVVWLCCMKLSIFKWYTLYVFLYVISEHPSEYNNISLVNCWQEKCHVFLFVIFRFISRPAVNYLTFSFLVWKNEKIKMILLFKWTNAIFLPITGYFQMRT